MSATPSDESAAREFAQERAGHRDRWIDFWTKAAALRDRLFPGEFGRLYQQVHPHSMMSYGRLRGMYRGVCEVLAKNVPGDFVECGTARGGCAALIGLTARARGQTRRLWVFDTFEGLPEPSRDDPDYELAKSRVGGCRGEFEDVRALFEELDLLDHIEMVKGLFQDTVPQAGIEKISLLHLDGDWYDSTKVCLEHLFERVSPGGVVQIDDYGHWAGARKALHEYFDAHGLNPQLRYLDYTGRQFVKS